MLPLSRVLMLYSSGSSVESVEHPCFAANLQPVKFIPG